MRFSLKIFFLIVKNCKLLHNTIILGQIGVFLVREKYAAAGGCRLFPPPFGTPFAVSHLPWGSFAFRFTLLPQKYDGKSQYDPLLNYFIRNLFFLLHYNNSATDYS